MSGVLRNARGTKVLVYLLDTALVVGRQVTRQGVGKVTQVYREPIPTCHLICQDLTDSDTSAAARQGSFHRAFSSQAASKNAFRVQTAGQDVDQEGADKGHTLLAADEHTKKQWVTVIQKAIVKAHLGSETDSTGAGKVNSRTPRSSPRRLNKAQKKLSGQLLNMPGRNSSPKLISASRLLSTPGGPKLKSSSRLASAAKLLSPRPGLFKKNTKSPLIKSSLSQSTLEKIQSGGVRKIRSKPRLNDENIYRAADIVMDGSVSVLGKRRSKSAARVTNQPTKKSRRMLQLIDENSK